MFKDLIGTELQQGDNVVMAMPGYHTELYWSM